MQAGGLDRSRTVGDDGDVDRLDRWYDKWTDRDWWFLRNVVLLIAVVPGYMIVASLTLWRLTGFPPGQDLLSFVIFGTYFWLMSMGPLGLIALDDPLARSNAVVAPPRSRSRTRVAHERPLDRSIYLARVADNESAFVLIDAIVPALLFGALLRLPPRPGAESPPKTEVRGSDWSV